MTGFTAPSALRSSAASEGDRHVGGMRVGGAVSEFQLRSSAASEGDRHRSRFSPTCQARRRVAILGRLGRRPPHAVAQVPGGEVLVAILGRLGRRPPRRQACEYRSW